MRTPRRKRLESVSPLFASVGPRPAHVQRFVVGELAFSGETPSVRRELILGEHADWRAKHLEAWLAGGRVPGPPWANVFDTFARPAA